MAAYLAIKLNRIAFWAPVPSDPSAYTTQLQRLASFDDLLWTELYSPLPPPAPSRRSFSEFTASPPRYRRDHARPQAYHESPPRSRPRTDQSNRSGYTAGSGYVKKTADLNKQCPGCKNSGSGLRSLCPFCNNMAPDYTNAIPETSEPRPAASQT